MVPKNERKSRKIPYNCNRKPKSVNMYHPVMMQSRPRKKKRLPLILDSLRKNPRAFLAPTSATTPIRKDIYTVSIFCLTFPIASMLLSRKRNTPKKYITSPSTINPIPISTVRK